MKVAKLSDLVTDAELDLMEKYSNYSNFYNSDVKNLSIESLMVIGFVLLKTTSVYYTNGFTIASFTIEELTKRATQQQLPIFEK